MNGCELIASERRRQVKIEGYTPIHDAEHYNGALARAAAGYALASVDEKDRRTPTVFPRLWTFKRSTGIRMLVKAGALIAAEIDRRLHNGEKA